MIRAFNPCPVVGILCIDVALRILVAYGSDIGTYIDAAYVKFLEFTGCQVIPIWSGKNEEYYENIMKKINGILIPGGSVNFDPTKIIKPEQTNACVDSFGKIFRIACKMNQNGIYFPLWGTCLGFELMLYHAFKDECFDEVREKCKRMNTSTKLEFTSNFVESKMFGRLSGRLEKCFLNEPFAFHSHGYCITTKKLQKLKSFSQWRVTSTNRDETGLEYISSLEHKSFPFYGVQFHPEKVLFDFNRNTIKRNGNIIRCAQYFGNFFASECRKSPNSFPTKEDLRRHLIHNYAVTCTPIKGFEQCYLFMKADARSKNPLARLLDNKTPAT